MSDEKTVLYYVHDPMCSWCWGFRPVWQEVKQALQNEVKIDYLVGGLAPDSTEAMPLELQQKLAQTWRTIEEKIPGTRFNFDFWQQCSPRRSTYPACRAVLIAKQAAPELEEAMIYAIQKAYYEQARNPSDDDTLIALAIELGLGGAWFAEQLHAPETEQLLQRDFDFARSLGGQGFPSLILRQGGDSIFIPHSYTDVVETLRRIHQYL